MVHPSVGSHDRARRERVTGPAATTHRPTTVARVASHPDFNRRLRMAAAVKSQVTESTDYRSRVAGYTAGSELHRPRDARAIARTASV